MYISDELDFSSITRVLVPCSDLAILMDKRSLKLIEELCNAPGPSGFEREVARMCKDYASKYADRVYNDNIGNMMFEKGGDDGPTVLFAAHMDECGFIVTGIESHGYLTFNQLGGWFDQVLLGQRVLIMSKKGPLNGVIACKPPHMMESEEMKKVVTKDKMYIDLGCANKDEAEEFGVRLGDCVVPDSRFHWFTKTAFKDGKKNGKRTLAMGKAFDDRLGVCTILDLIRSLKEGNIKHPNKVVAACTVQEEVGTRGAKTVANSVKPDVAIIVDVDIAGDVPGIDQLQAPARMGGGLAITVWDGGMIPNQPLKEMVISVCEKKKIPYQLSYVKGGSTDGMAIHVANTGVPTIAIGIPVRHIHSHVGVFDLQDQENCLKLCLELVKAMDRETVESFTKL
jgi:putative aminopeptidase FrvX